jgi:hypothetical protein
LTSEEARTARVQLLKILGGLSINSSGTHQIQSNKNKTSVTRFSTIVFAKDNNSQAIRIHR